MPLIASAVALAIFAAAGLLALGFSPRAQLVPGLVTTLGTVLAALSLAREVRRLRRLDRGRRSSWDENVRTTMVAFGWLTMYLVLIFTVGLVVGSSVFLPLFLWKVAQRRFRSVAIYTSATVLVLILAGVALGFELPSGLYGDLFIVV